MLTGKERVALVKRILESPAQPETEEARRDREKKIRETVIPRGANQAPLWGGQSWPQPPFEAAPEACPT